MPTAHFHYRCSVCQTTYAEDEVTYTCPADGGNLDIVLDVHPTPDVVRNAPERSMWRYLPLLPVDDPGGADTPLRRVGATPMYAPPALREQLGLPHLWIKDESSNPTASFKDRASALVVARAREIGAEVIVTASTGNAGAALAGMAAAVGQRVVIFAPRTAPPAKIAQLLVFGAQVILVDGTYDHAFDLSVQAAEAFGWYCRNTGYNPFTTEGKKTAAFEIWEHFAGLSEPPDWTRLWVFVPVGDGNIISGVYKGFRDLYDLGWIDALPRLIGVQAEGSAAIAHAFRAGSDEVKPVQASTLADSIAVDLPRDGFRALRAMRASGGDCLTVSDEDILAALADLGQVGIFAEPAAAAAFAGLKQAVDQGRIPPEDPVVVLSTGSGLKDVGAAMRAVSAAPVIEPTLEAVRRVITL